MLLPALPSASGPFVGPGDRYPNRQLKTKSVPVWLLADSQPHSLHSLKRLFWRRSIVINHFGSKGASPALPSAPPCTEARRGPILARKRWASGIAASTLSSSGAGPNPCSPTTKPEFPVKKASAARPFHFNNMPVYKGDQQLSYNAILSLVPPVVSGVSKFQFSVVLHRILPLASLFWPNSCFA